MAQRKVSCEVYTDRGIVGKEGADGKSAYQQAVSGGYQGTEEEFEQALASDIAIVANNVTNINAVGNNIENVNTVAGNATNINTVATNISSINTAATNMPAIIAAPTEAANAANSATEASASATIATTQAELAKGYADSIDLSNYRTSADQDIIDATKQDTISDLSTIREGAELGATSVQPEDLATVATSGMYSDLTGTPGVATADTLGLVKPDGTTITVTEDGTISAVGGSGPGTAGLSIGDVVYSYSSLSSENPGKLPLFTGETITSANTIYPEFYNWVSAHTELQCTTEEYESALTTYGECAKYVIGSGSLRLPLIKNYIKAANPSEGIKNVKAGLPNIIGDVRPNGESGNTWPLKTGDYSGAFSAITSSSFAASVTSLEQNKPIGIHFDASKYDAVYGASSTVTPASTTLYPWVVAYTAAVPASTAQAAEFQQALSGKADTNLGNIPSNYDYVVESYNDGTNWYRVYKSGWIEQGGRYTIDWTGTVTKDITFNLLKPYADNSYGLLISVSSGTDKTNSTDNRFYIGYKSKNETSFIKSLPSNNYSNGFDWYACGQGAE